MYLKFFGLNDKPFSITPDIQYLYLGAQHEKALDTLMYGVTQRLGFVLLTGEVGAGKTTLSRALLSRLDNTTVTSLLVNPLFSVPELYKKIASDFGVSTRNSTSQKQIDALYNFLLKLEEKKKNALIVVDEAQNLSLEMLEALRMLSNLETEKTKLLQIMLVSQPELLGKLKSHELRQLNQRITARFHLMPLSKVEMMRYINHRICIAGGGGKIFFEPDAYQMIFRETKGYPRLVNLLCDRALMASFVRSTYVVDNKAVRAAVADWKGRPPASFWGFIRRLVFS